MSALVVDTSAWVEYFRGHGDAAIIESALGEGSVYLPLPVAGELLSGRLTKGRRKDLEEVLTELPNIGETSTDWQLSGALRANLAEKGIVASMIDTHIAYCAITANGFLLSKEKIFRRIAKVTTLQLVV